MKKVFPVEDRSEAACFTFKWDFDAVSRHFASRLIVAAFTVIVACAGLCSAAPVRQQTTHPLQPKTTPQAIYVADFAIDTAEVKQESGIWGEGGPLRGSLMERLHPLHRQEDPEETARRLVNLLADSLTQDLENYALPAKRLLPGQPLPGKGWMITGQFLEVDEGNRLRRAIIGFGAGASEMQIEVKVTDMSTHPDSPFLVMGTSARSGDMPGAIVFPNPYVAAAKFILSKDAPEKDVTKAASNIAGEIVKYMKTRGLMP